MGKRLEGVDYSHHDKDYRDKLLARRTPTELRAFYLLREHFPSVEIKEQVTIRRTVKQKVNGILKIVERYRFFADMELPQYKVIIEFDGGIHDGRDSYDTKRDLLLMKSHLVVRFPNETILFQPEKFIATMREVIESRKPKIAAESD